MNEKEKVQKALDLGFTNAVFMDVKDLEFDKNLRRFCEENTCGNYGKNYACPPDCGTPGEMEARVKSCSRALVLQTIQRVTDVMDPEETKKARKKHNGLTRDWLKAADGQGLTVMAGPCAVCSVCNKTEGKPCSFPQKVASCLSAYCICAEKMANHCNLPYWCGENQVAFFSMYLE